MYKINKQTAKFAVSTVDRFTVELSFEVIIGFIGFRHDLLSRGRITADEVRDALPEAMDQ